MQNHSATPRELILSLWRNRGLTYSLAYREIVGRYKGSVLGMLWTLINPILMLSVYTFVFSVVFKARWAGGSDSKVEFALILYIGLMIFNLFAECVTSAPNLIVSNANYVKKVIFPLEILPWVTLFGAMFHFVVSLGVWLIAYVILVGYPSWKIIYMPIVITPYILLIVGICWFLASISVYMRDLGQVIGLVVTVIMFMSPIFFPISSIPENFRPFMYANPLTVVIEMSRNILLWGVSPDSTLLFKSTLISLVVFYAGFLWFQVTRKGFADVV